MIGITKNLLLMTQSKKIATVNLCSLHCRNFVFVEKLVQTNMNEQMCNCYSHRVQ